MNIEKLEEKYQKLAQKHGQTMLKLAFRSIEHGIKHKKPIEIDSNDFDEELRQDGAVFVTINKGENLRGCIGSAFAHRPLIQDLVENAFSSAFRDPRFEKLTKGELDEIKISISVLTPAVDVNFASQEDLLSKIRQGKDGLILEDKGQRGLFLPIVWEQLPNKQDFLAHLKLKAGFPPTYWSDSLKIKRFTAIYIN